MIGVKWNEFVGEGELRHIPQLRVVPIGKAYRFRKPGHIQQHIARAENKLGQLAVDAVDQTSQRSRQRAIQAAKERLHGRSEGLKDANRI